MPYKTHKQYRLPGYDYARGGDYFITICTKNRIRYFGKIFKTKDDAFIELSPIGSFATECIELIPVIFPHASLGETIVMPDHVHLVVILENSALQNAPKQSKIQHALSPNKGLKPLTPGSVSSIVNHLKGKVKKWCNLNGYPSFEWQARFHDHIIRDAESFDRINNYITNNIWNWRGGEIDCHPD